MVTKAAAKTAARRPGQASWWLIARDGPCGRLEALTVGDGNGRTLPVFGFREEAELFLHLAGPGTGDGGWRVRESRAGELVSVLYGPCRGVRRVALDPPPEVVDGRAAGPWSMGRGRFVGFVVGDGRGPRREWERYGKPARARSTR